MSDGATIPPDSPLILLISGSLRDGSVNAAVLRTAAALATGAIATETFTGLADLPPFSPDDDGEGAVAHPAVAALRAQLARADAILFCTPEYAGSLPGSFKNLLDWSVGGGETHGLPVAWINASGPAAPTGGAGAHAALRSVLTYTGTVIIDDACRRVPVTRDGVGLDGLVSAGGARTQITGAVDALAAAVRHPERHAADPAERVAAADAAFFAALRSADADTLDGLLADDFMIVEVGAGAVHARDAFLGAVRDGLVRFTAIETDPAESLVRVHGALAVVIGETRMTLAGTPGTVHSRYTHVFDTDGGAWRLRSAQGTPINAPAER